jgi:YD repeat-containing protein
VARGATVLWNVSSQDAANRATGVVLGNGLSQLKGFNPYTGRLDWATLTVPAGAAQLQEAYQYDVLGNVTNRTQYWGSADKLQGYSEDFTYDKLNRLWSSHIHDQPSLTFTYDAAGNIKSKTGTGTYAYPEQGASAVRPHAVQSIDSLPGTFAYDLNGNQLISPGRSASWTSFDMQRQLAKR